VQRRLGHGERGAAATKGTLMARSTAAAALTRTPHGARHLHRPSRREEALSGPLPAQAAEARPAAASGDAFGGVLAAIQARRKD
jgi:hypothetical protein